MIGTGANDPQKMDPKASRETLDHSIMYILAVAFQDGEWHHVRSYAPERAQREDTVRLWHKITTEEEAAWTEMYHDPDPDKRAFGGRLEVTMKNGETVVDELAVANAHPAGARPFARDNYIHKFKTLTDGIISAAESARFLELVQDLPNLSSAQVADINVQVDATELTSAARDSEGIF